MSNIVKISHRYHLNRKKKD